MTPFQIDGIKFALSALEKTDSEPGSYAWEREKEAIAWLTEILAFDGENSDIGG